MRNNSAFHVQNNMAWAVRRRSKPRVYPSGRPQPRIAERARNIMNLLADGHSRRYRERLLVKREHTSGFLGHIRCPLDFQAFSFFKWPSIVDCTRLGHESESLDQTKHLAVLTFRCDDVEGWATIRALSLFFAIYRVPLPKLRKEWVGKRSCCRA
ncbi:uncharacterized protein LOC111270543 [Varroa jacobsoni]|uniref:uncharacterized protein LOC111270543 n=1 Tax=Varroa jacobsoni TaxID=62625 RepID=UPI000BF88C80|nr:uncharacterized protein LOC111270543 [Varroa jacobsoni]